MPTIVSIEYGSPEHRAALELRQRVLRAPLGLAGFSPREEELEKTAILFGCVVTPSNAAGELDANSSPDLIGTLLLQELAPDTFQMRQVAVDPLWQGRGIGRRLLAAAESWCLRRQPPVAHLVAHARAPVVPFYEHLGYVAEGDFFEEVSIPHRLVRKRFDLPGGR